MEMTSHDKCSRCGVSQLADTLAGPCPGCLLQNALSSSGPVTVSDHDIGDASSSGPTSIGDYDIIDVLGRGGMGVIYRAKHRSSDRVVALKVIQSGELATPEERQRFRAEIEAARALAHDHIVPIDEVGEDAGRPYYTMKVYPGVLARELARFRAPKVAAALVAQVARAVHHGHVRGVLHRDLKPANILLDQYGEPHVGDFGTAKRLGEPGLTATGVMVGTPMYMAPEQAAGSARGITTAVDIYSLGVILYELLTGEPPFGGTSVSILQALRDKDREPVSPRVHVPSVPSKLETICLRCLEKQPRARYSTAEALANDLERFLRGEPIEARPRTVRERIWRFTQRHWLVVGAGIGTMLLLGVVAATAIAVTRAQELELEREALRSNGPLASTVADAVSEHLNGQIKSLTEQFPNRDIAALLPGSDQQPAPCPKAPDPPKALEPHPGDARLQELRKLSQTYDDVTVMDRCGTILAFAARTTRFGDVKSEYGFRDYFQRAQQLGKQGRREGSISRAFKAEVDGRYKFAITVPIYDGNDQDSHWIGVLMATINTNSVWGRAPLPAWSDDAHRLILVAPQDRARNARDAPDGYVVLLHDAVNPGENGEKYAVDSPRLSEFSPHGTEVSNPASSKSPITDDNFHDPMPGFEGRWLAGFAPVRKTPLVVILETRYPAVRMSLRLLGPVSAAILVWSAVFGLTTWSFARRRRAQTAFPDSRRSLPSGGANAG